MNRSKKNATLVVLAFVLIAASNAEAYTELWGGGGTPPGSFSSVYYYNSACGGPGPGVRFDILVAGDSGYIQAVSMPNDTDLISKNTYAAGGIYNITYLYGDVCVTERLQIQLTNIYGKKQTGRTGTPYGSGSWTALATSKLEGETRETFTIFGHWTGYFYYNDSPIHWAGTATVDSTRPSGKLTAAPGDFDIPFYSYTP